MRRTENMKWLGSMCSVALLSLLWLHGSLDSVNALFSQEESSEQLTIISESDREESQNEEDDSQEEVIVNLDQACLYSYLLPVECLRDLIATFDSPYIHVNSPPPECS